MTNAHERGIRIHTQAEADALDGSVLAAAGWQYSEERTGTSGWGGVSGSFV